jgi:pimeloyl-ACP methyl ester carboxylesterase
VTVAVGKPGPDVTTTDGHRLTTRVLGDDGGAPIVILQHGVGSSVTFLVEAIAPPLVAAGWCVVAADLRGHGDASPVVDVASYGLSLLAADVGALVAATGAVACGGVSLGGHAAVAAAVAGLVDDTRLVAALPAWLGPSLPGVGAHALVADEVRRVGIAGMLARLAAETGLPAWLHTVLLRDLAASDPASLEAALLALDGGVAPTLDELATLPLGLGVVSWPDDPGHPLAVARAWAKAATGSNHVTLAISDLDDSPHALGRAMLIALGNP